VTTDRNKAVDRELLDEQIAYYRARASEYDEWFLLELACGTGLWTRHLAPRAERLVAVDAAPEAIEHNRARVGDARVEYAVADLFAWNPEPSQRFDFVFFGFWLSHVPEARFDAFWEQVAAWLDAGGTVFLVDNTRHRDSPAHNHRIEGPAPGVSLRYLNDGRCFDIVKHFYEPDALSERLRALGWRGRVATTPRYFLHAALERAA
jgi:SAM-dependent methyltransferase